MTCDQFLASLVAGGPLRRRQAKRHAARCARCAEIAAQVRPIARELSEPAPLTAAQRALWTAVSVAGPGPSHRRSPVRPVRVALATAAVLIVVAIAVRSTAVVPVRRHAPPPIVVKTPHGATPGTERTELFTTMRAGLDRVGRALSDLRRQADLIDVRKDADRLWVRYAGRAASTPL